MAEEKKGFFQRLADGLSKTRDNIVSGMDSIFNGFSISRSLPTAGSFSSRVSGSRWTWERRRISLRPRPPRSW